MDYKKWLKSETVRYAILDFLSFVPDRLMVQLQYKIKLGRKLNLSNPLRYSEKLQWYKLYYRNQLMPECADKASVRDYVKSKGLEEILNESYGTYSSLDEIHWDELPNHFVLKDTLGGGGRSMIFVYDKTKIHFDDIKDKLNSWLNISPNKKNFGREWLYENRKHRIIAEKILINSSSDDLPDYKFFCFDGKVFCSYMMQNYTLHHEDGVLGFLDKDFHLLKAHRADFKPMIEQPVMPQNYDKMVKIAETLSQGFPHVRIDLYNLQGKIIFGEMTFFNASGYTQFEPDEFDYELGEQFILPLKNN